MDSIDGEDMTTHPVTVSLISPQAIAYPLLIVNTPPQTEGETTAGMVTDDHGDHIYVNRHLVPMCPDSGDVDLDDIPSMSDINMTPPISPLDDNKAGHCLYENTREPPEDSTIGSPSKAGDSLYENIPEEDVQGTCYYENTRPPEEGGRTLSPSLPPRPLAGSELLEISNLEEKDDLLEDKLKPDVADLITRLMFYLRQDVARQNIKYCYDLLEKVDFVHKYINTRVHKYINTRVTIS